MGPPPIPKGTPHPLTRAIKPSVISPGKVWVQGKLRDKASKAAKHQRKIDERVAEKALRRPTLGKIVYAYNHVRTNQVVFSLSRFLEENKVLPQLLNHGKKTQPPSLRRDLWAPYFSIHFPTTKHGLIAYQQLRELSVLRQLAPPDSLITNSEASRLRFYSHEMYNPNSTLKMPPIGKIMPKAHRARVLMDQKATTVADLALVLELQKEVDTSKTKPLHVTPEMGNVPRSERKHIRRYRETFQRLQNQYEEATEVVLDPRVPFSNNVVARIASSSDNVHISSGNVTISNENTEQEASTDRIQVLWADLRDAAYAKSWPETVEHGELGRKLQVASNNGQRIFSSIHVMGTERDRIAELEAAEERKAAEDLTAAQLDAAERETRRQSSANPSSLPSISSLPGVHSIGTIEPPPKSLGSKVAEKLMFWR